VLPFTFTWRIGLLKNNSKFALHTKWLA